MRSGAVAPPRSSPRHGVLSRGSYMSRVEGPSDALCDDRPPHPHTFPIRGHRADSAVSRRSANSVAGWTDSALRPCQRLRDRRHVERGSLLVRRVRVHLPQLERSAESASKELRPVLLRPALTHQQSISGGRDQPGCGAPPGLTDVTKFQRLSSKVICDARILFFGAVLEYHGSMEEVGGGADCFRRQQFADSESSRKIPIDDAHLKYAFGSIRLISDIDRPQLLVHWRRGSVIGFDIIKHSARAELGRTSGETKDPR